MEFNFELAKKHPYAVGGTLLAVFAIAYLYVRSKKSTASASTTSDLSYGSSQLQSLTSAAQLANAQANAQQSIAEVQGNVMNQQTSAQLQSDLTKTAAELQLGLAQTTATQAIAASQAGAAVQIQQLQSDAQVAVTQIEGNTYDFLASKSAATQQAQIAVQQSQVDAANAQISFVLAQGGTTRLSTGTGTVNQSGPVSSYGDKQAKNLTSILNSLTGGVLAETGQGIPAASAVQSGDAAAAAASKGGILPQLLGGLATAEQTQPFHF